MQSTRWGSCTAWVPLGPTVTWSSKAAPVLSDDQRLPGAPGVQVQEELFESVEVDAPARRGVRPIRRVELDLTNDQSVISAVSR